VNLGTAQAWEKLGYNIWRASVPGGWLVATFQGGVSDSIAFLPDPSHAWDGQALWAAGAQRSRQGGAVSLLPEREE